MTKEEARKKFMNDLAEAEDKLKSDPDEYPQSRKWEENKKDLTKLDHLINTHPTKLNYFISK